MAIIGKKPKPQFTIKLWSINKWVRWFGFRVLVALPSEWRGGEPYGPISVGLIWYGWGFIGREPHRGRWE